MQKELQGRNGSQLAVGPLLLSNMGVKFHRGARNLALTELSVRCAALCFRRPEF